jgi:hypothetical protein
MSLGLAHTPFSIDNLDVVTDSVHFEVTPLLDEDGRVLNWSENWGRVRLEAPRVQSVETSVSD